MPLACNCAGNRRLVVVTRVVDEADAEAGPPLLPMAEFPLIWDWSCASRFCVVSWARLLGVMLCDGWVLLRLLLRRSTGGGQEQTCTPERRRMIAVGSRRPGCCKK